MYAYVKVIIERPDVRTLPLKALVHSGEQTFCWLYENGTAVRTEVETGVSDDKWVEVTNRRPPVPQEAPSDSVPWTAIDGREQVIVGDLSGLVDGALVHVAPATPDMKLAGDTRASDLKPNTRRLPGDARQPDNSRPARRLP